jgi:hypothetical protein
LRPETPFATFSVISRGHSSLVYLPVTLTKTGGEEIKRSFWDFWISVSKGQLREIKRGINPVSLTKSGGQEDDGMSL